ncbi:MAG: redoxin domain-containing protein, partial [Salinivirgaceae bacterium]|nr:redoxin domain-containing protein [Salinivirgaceae bacterium]
MRTLLSIAIAVLFFNFTATSQTIGTKVGQIAPEISMKSPEGKTIALSELRGKVVLIDFW